jgi:hypothetical protein
MACLANHAAGAGRVDRPEDGSHVLRILNAIEHDEEWRAIGPICQFVNRVRRERLELGRNALVHTAAGHFLEGPAIERFDRDPELLSARNDRIDSRTGASLMDEARDAARLRMASATAWIP